MAQCTSYLRISTKPLVGAGIVHRYLTPTQQRLVDCHSCGKLPHTHSDWRQVLYNILTDLGIHMKLVTLSKMNLNETYSKVCNGKHFTHFLLV
jgi:hypothetical protein